MFTFIANAAGMALPNSPKAIVPVNKSLEAIGEEGGFGVNRFREKLDLIENEKEKSEDITAVAASLLKYGIQTAKSLYRATKDGVTPEFWHRINNKKSSNVQISVVEE